MLYALIVELAPGHPVPTAGMQDLTPYYIRYVAVLCTMQLFESLGAIFLLLFISGLATHLRRLEGRSSLLTTAAVTAGVTVVSLRFINSAATLLAASAECVDAENGTRHVNPDLAVISDVTWPLGSTSLWLIATRCAWTV